MENIQIESFEIEVKRMGHLVQKLREGRRVTIFDGTSKTFYRFRLNPSEKRVFWIKEASLDQRNWVIQNTFFSLRNVMQNIYNNKIKNNLND
jgi:hypothetical protein